MHNMYWCGPEAERTAAQAKTDRKKGGGAAPAPAAAVAEEEEDGGAAAAAAEGEGEGEEEEEGEEDLPKKGKAGGKGKGKAAWSSFGSYRKRMSDALKAEKAAKEARGGDDEGDGADAPPPEPKLEKSVLHSVRWWRVVLDEAHSIKDRRSNTAKAVFALTSDNRWALSGTPLQNRIAELYSQGAPGSYFVVGGE